MKNNLFRTQGDAVQEELTDIQQEWINNYAQIGNDEIENENFEHAIGWFSKALEIIPEPKSKWEATGWLNASIGDAYFYLHNYAEGIKCLHKAYDIYGPDDVNPFVLLRLGQCYFHLNNEAMSKDYLLQAFLMEGEELFEDETLYFDFLRSKYTL